MNLQILTPQAEVVRTEALSVSVPGVLGRMQILPGHTQIISLLKAGVLAYEDLKGRHQWHVGAGHIEVVKDHVTVAVDSALAS
ncbi:MAG: F0F1 ATP synthase subunit epsilon [Deltaproteobacteria bacterium]|nr:F0F1 ATP synthase subunit epsilon [Deltaproteobacteria bacterium]